MSYKETIASTMDRDKASPSHSTLQESLDRPPPGTLQQGLVDGRKNPGQRVELREDKRNMEI
ncbi:hypothetical protein J4Q44_G00288890 [Coregonus suidteri]|uniref:Uncharacterized protein n=1 Tax=Coregonus suidteri TaxID=861788 RepID=A0AAN8L7V0_9TELE